MELKEKFPKNRLIKHLISSAWGHLNMFNCEYITKKQFIEKDKEGKTIGMDTDNDYTIHEHKKFINTENQEINADTKCDKEYYKIIPTDKPYKYNIYNII